MGDRPIARPVLIHDSTTQRNADIHPCLERNSGRDPSVEVFQTVRVLYRTATVSKSEFLVIIQPFFCILNYLPRVRFRISLSTVCNTFQHTVQIFSISPSAINICFRDFSEYFSQ